MVITINGSPINIDLDTILIWCLVGLVAGFLASRVALGHGLGCLAEERRPVVTEVAVGKTPRQQTKYQQRAQQGHHAGITVTQRTGPLASHHLSLGQPLEGRFAHRAKNH